MPLKWAVEFVSMWDLPEPLWAGSKLQQDPWWWDSTSRCMWGVTLEREPEVLGGLAFPGPGEKKQQVFGLCAERCALLSLAMRAFSTNTELLAPNWFADHLYRRDFSSFATELPVLPQNNMLGEKHFQLWEVGYSHHSLAALPLHGGQVVLFQGFY